MRGVRRSSRLTANPTPRCWVELHMRFVEWHMREERRRREPTAVKVRQAKLNEGLSKMLLWYRNADWLTRRKHMLRERRIVVFPKIV